MLAARLVSIGKKYVNTTTTMTTTTTRFTGMQMRRSLSSGGGVIKFVDSHEYIRKEGKEYVVGITDYAQTALGDVVFVEFMVEPGDIVKKGKDFGTVESVKAASDVYMPVDGKILEVNNALNENPGLVNKAAMSQGWFLKIAVSDESQLNSLMDAKAYATYCEKEAAKNEEKK